MGRQRTINDAEFWRSPRIADRTQEDKATLLYLLTSPYSNIIGVFALVPRIVAAEMGWTAEQLLAILKRLGSVELVRFEDSSGFVWVRNWWDHNSAKMAVATTLREKTYSQIAAIPAAWRAELLADFLMRIPAAERTGPATKDDLRHIVASDMASRGYTVPITFFIFCWHLDSCIRPRQVRDVSCCSVTGSLPCSEVPGRPVCQVCRSGNRSA